MADAAFALAWPVALLRHGSSVARSHPVRIPRAAAIFPRTRRCPSMAGTAQRLKSQIPNVLTWMRVAAVPALTCIGLVPVFAGQRAVLAGCFVGAAVTDFLDGYLARRWNVSSKFGAFLDPVADKLMVAAALVLVSVRFALSPAAPAIAVSSIVILTREVFVSALREWMASAFAGGRDVVQVGFAGKVKTALQMVALSILLAVKDAASPFGMIGTVLLALSALLSVSSAAGYLQAALPSFNSLE